MSEKVALVNIPLSTGAKINDFTINKKISSGGFSIVYLGFNKNKVPVAIKEFFPNYLHLRNKGEGISFINMKEKQKFQEGLKSFKREMELIMQLKHPNIIEIIDYIETNGTAYIVMPYIYGNTLGKYIQGMIDIEEKDVASIMIGVISAIQTIHKANIVHLDLKPGNIFLSPSKEPLILDFGTSRFLDDKETRAIPPMHTPGYAALEQHKEFFIPEKIGPWTDYYGIGTTLYAMLEKNAPTAANLLFMEGKAINYSENRKGHYNSKLLEIVDELMMLDFEQRKKINLNNIIEKLKSIKTTKKIDFITESLFDVI